MQYRFFVLAVLGSASLLSAQGWSAWRSDQVFHGIEVRERCTGFNEFANRTVWDVELRNTYQKAVDVTWAAEPARLHGADTQSGQAVALRPGEVVAGHHTAPQNCSAGLAVRVNEVRSASVSLPPYAAPVPAPAPPVASASAPAASFRPVLEGHWTSKDPEPLRKDLRVQLSGKTVTSTYTSPSFSFQISTPLPERVTGSVSIEPVGPETAR